ncbi:MAG TPA: hypothetical protein VM093_09155 [Aeromicrobium sp.]|nr:hypothetical protein [Aeromicrobium sp.]
MRWDRLFGELEGHAEHLRLEERDVLVAELRQGEWAERTWLDGLAGDSAAIDISVRAVGVLTGRVRWVTEHTVCLEAAVGNHVIACAAVQWVRGVDRSPGLRRDSVRARLGWGPVFREAQDERDDLTVTLLGGEALEGRVTAVGRDFVRLGSAAGRERDVPHAAIAMVTVHG